MKCRHAVFAMLFVVLVSPLFGAPPPPQFIVEIRAGEKAEQFTAAVLAAGGRIDSEWRNRLIVTLPGSIDALQLPVVSSVQRVLNGAADASVPDAPITRAPARLAPHPQNYPWDSGAYSYDGEGNITAIGSGATGSAFTYDEFSRLTSANVIGNTESYTYDRWGNMATKTTRGQLSTLGADASNHLNGHCYDEAGNMVDDPINPAVCFNTVEAHRFDALNMMTRKWMRDGTASEFYVYNANDERVAVIPCPELGPCTEQVALSFRDESGQVLRQFKVPYAQFGSAWTWVEDYVYRGGQLLAAERPSAQGGRRHFHLDHLGTPRVITNDAGQRLSEHTYFPFGEEITPLRQETVAGLDREEPRKFTGHERDFTVGTGFENTNYLDYMHARYTAPLMGRFLSVDPMLNFDRALRNPQNWNRYAYVLNNPVNSLDPNGKDLSETLDLIAERLRHAQTHFDNANAAMKKVVVRSCSGGGRIFGAEYKALDLKAEARVDLRVGRMTDGKVPVTIRTAARAGAEGSPYLAAARLDVKGDVGAVQRWMTVTNIDVNGSYTFGTEAVAGKAQGSVLSLTGTFLGVTGELGINFTEVGKTVGETALGFADVMTSASPIKDHEKDQ